MEGSRFNCRIVGSASRPVDSGAITPSNGSASDSANGIVPPTISPMNSISANLSRGNVWPVTRYVGSKFGLMRTRQERAPDLNTDPTGRDGGQAKSR